MVTLKDVAQKAGVNISTVSRVLNSNKNISSKTAEIVRQAAKELGYVPNYTARILAGKKSNIIGIMVPEIHSDYYSNIINTIELNLQKKGYFLFIANTQYNTQKEIHAIQNFINYNVDGVFITAQTDSESLTRYQDILSSHNVPMVALDVRNPIHGINQIIVDELYGFTEAILQLKKKGHKKFCFLGDSIMDLCGRTDLFRQAAAANKISVENTLIEIHPTKRFEEAGYESMQKCLSAPNYPTAYIAGYDDMAIGAMKAVYEHNLEIPKDIAMIGIDDSREAEYLYRSLSSLRPPIERMSAVAVDIMLNLISQKEETEPEFHSVVLKPTLYFRETT